MDTAVRNQIEQLQDAPLARLREKYREVFHEEPRVKHRMQLFRRLAWRIQALAEGDLSERARQRALDVVADADLRVLPPRARWDRSSSNSGTVRIEGFKVRHDRRIPPPGSQLSREYRGNMVLVQVLSDAFEYQGRLYRSLSAIACQVTGTRWNGLAFFGLTGNSKGEKGGRHGRNR